MLIRQCVEESGVSQAALHYRPSVGVPQGMEARAEEWLLGVMVREGEQEGDSSTVADQGGEEEYADTCPAQSQGEGTEHGASCTALHQEDSGYADRRTALYPEPQPSPGEEAGYADSRPVPSQVEETGGGDSSVAQRGEQPGFGSLSALAKAKPTQEVGRLISTLSNELTLLLSKGSQELSRLLSPVCQKLGYLLSAVSRELADLISTISEEVGPQLSTASHGLFTAVQKTIAQAYSHLGHSETYHKVRPILIELSLHIRATAAHLYSTGRGLLSELHECVEPASAAQGVSYLVSSSLRRARSTVSSLRSHLFTALHTLHPTHDPNPNPNPNPLFTALQTRTQQLSQRISKAALHVRSSGHFLYSTGCNFIKDGVECLRRDATCQWVYRNFLRFNLSSIRDFYRSEWDRTTIRLPTLSSSLSQGGARLTSSLGGVYTACSSRALDGVRKTHVLLGGVRRTHFLLYGSMVACVAFIFWPVRKHIYVGRWKPKLVYYRW